MSLLERRHSKPPVLPKKEIAVRRDPERTRERILQSAMQEFSRTGLDGARVDEIARRSGVNKRLIYHYFGNKRELFLGGSRARL